MQRNISCLWYAVVTGLHDIDEYIQAQLLLAVSSTYWLIYIIFYELSLLSVSDVNVIQQEMI